MATVINTLYPPQIGGSGTFMPAFVVDKDNAGTAKVQFSISPYNTKDSIKGVHITCVRMDSNLNALDAPTGVYYISFSALEKASDSGDEYFIPIYYSKPKDEDTSTTQEGEEDTSTKVEEDTVGQARLHDPFVTDTYYKVQLRFDCTPANDLPIKEGGNAKGISLDAGYLTAHTDSFSEWSSVCLIRAIGTPSVTLTGFFGDNASFLPEYSIPSFNKGIIPVSGNVVFSPSGEQIESYEVTVRSDTTEEVVSESGTLFSTNNNIDYKLDTEGYSSSQGSKFTIELSFVTQNQYTFSKSFSFELGEFSRNDYFKPIVSVESLPDNGAVRVTVENSTSVSGVLLIKRGSSLNDYHDWETVYATAINGPINLSYEDMTVCSGVIYRYSATLETVKGSHLEDGSFKVSQRFFTKAYKSIKVIPDFYDAMFYRLGRQIAVRYNFSISSFKPVVNRTKVDTLGGKYPRFVENANLGYKQFSLTGMISSQEDPDYKFLSREDYYQDNLNDILKYNSNNEVRSAYDFFWEREFREELLKWLNDGEPKLMRTMTEGNLCVMLTDISLTPNATLGRRLYTFSATAYEVEDGTDLTTIMSLGIHSNNLEEAEQKLGETVSAGKSVAKIEKIGQFYEKVPMMREPDTFYSVDSAVDAIMEPIRWQFSKEGVYLGHSATNVYLKDVKISFLSNPHLYTYSENTSIKTWNPDEKKTPSSNAPLLAGYRMSLNSKDIFVNIGRYYQVPSDIKVNSLSFPSVKEAEEDNRDVVTIDYVVCYDDELDKSKLPSSTENTTSYKNVFGQISGFYQAGERLGDRVYDKYSFFKKDETGLTTTYAMDYWKGISIETTPYAVFQIMFEDDTLYRRIVVGLSGVYNIDEGFPCEDLYFEGVKIFRHGCNRDINLEDDESEDVKPDNCYRGNLGVGEFLFGGNKKYRSKLQPGRVYIVNDAGDMQFYSLDKRWYDFTPEPETVPYINTGSTVVNYKPNRNPKAGIVKMPVEAILNYSGTIMKRYSAS